MFPSNVQSPKTNFRPPVVQVAFSGKSPAKPAEKTENRDVFQRSTSNIPDNEDAQIDTSVDTLLLGLQEDQSPLFSPETLQRLNTDDIALLSDADDSFRQAGQMLANLRKGKPVSAPVLPEGHPLKTVFAKQTEELKARQKREQVEAARKYGITDTPELRAELLKQGTVSDASEIPAFLEKFGL